MTKIFILIFGEEKTCQKPPCAPPALKLTAAQGTVPVSRVAQPRLCWPLPAHSQPSAPATPHGSWVTAARPQLQPGEAPGGRGNGIKSTEMP